MSHITDQEMQQIIRNANKLRSQETVRLIKKLFTAVKSMFHALFDLVNVQLHKSRSA